MLKRIYMKYASSRNMLCRNASPLKNPTMYQRQEFPLLILCQQWFVVVEGMRLLTFKTSPHHIAVALKVGRDKDNLRVEAVPRFPNELHSVRAATTLLRVPEYHPLGLDVLVDHVLKCCSKGLLKI